ncbi:hypothetical protein D9615_008152 [Tricholomella constricta]|uniref:Uncharacterized protein n=1 Tax=Tricholomella constricta TaxID=117010 RepID=A0A8H5H3F0_9AGAR|nr:hypothetical protein D9615_008152 [Tricholomella constricta]
MSSWRKRKSRSGHGPHSSQTQDPPASYAAETDLNPISALYIQAYEADIVRGPHAALSARSLESPHREFTASSSSKVGDALIKWDHQQLGARPAFPEDEEDATTGQVAKSGVQEDHAIWVDRYDARLLLDSIPTIQPVRSYEPVPDSPGGWSDLPSDNEDVFFFSPKEAEDFRRDKKRRHIDLAREERLRARRAEDGESSEEEDVWGGSNEEPDEPQRDFMRRTATHLLTSPNPAQLEMRILANHGGDRRFAFLRGRWSRAWQLLKAKAKYEKEQEQERMKGNMGGLGVLTAYGDSDADTEEADDEGEKAALEAVVEPAGPQPPLEDAENAAKEARRARAKEWAERRRILKDSAP